MTLRKLNAKASYSFAIYIEVGTESRLALLVVLCVTCRGRVKSAYHADENAVSNSTRLSHIVGLGQSNEQGAQSEPVVSKADLGDNALMFNRGTKTRSETVVPSVPEARDAASFVVIPLAPGGSDLWSGEPPAMGMISQLISAPARDGAGFSAGEKFLYSYPHIGGKHLCELDWRDFETHHLNPNRGAGGYQATFVDDIRRAKAAAEAAGHYYSVLAFHFTQGENEGLGYLLPGHACLSHDAFVPAYKADLAGSHARWDVDARAITLQPSTIPLFISQVDNCWAGQAQVELANKSPDVFLVGPIYYVPSALNSRWNGNMRGHRSHLSADGQRWRGEQAGKVMARVLFEKELWRPLQPRETARRGDTMIVLRFDVPRPPLVFETQWLPKAPDNGFEVYFGTQSAPGARIPISDIRITGPDEITIELDALAPLTKDAAIYVTYGQALTVGTTPSAVAAIRSGAPYEHDVGSTELVFPGDVRAAFAPLLQEGCFLLRQLTTPSPSTQKEMVPSASIVVRDMRMQDGATIVRGETRSLDGVLVLGVPCTIERDRPFGNLRDSDEAKANFVFSDTSYGTRHGQPYPLHNFCIVFTAEVKSL